MTGSPGSDSRSRASSPAGAVQCPATSRCSWAGSSSAIVARPASPVTASRGGAAPQRQAPTVGSAPQLPAPRSRVKARPGLPRAVRRRVPARAGRSTAGSRQATVSSRVPGASTPKSAAQLQPSAARTTSSRQRPGGTVARRNARRLPGVRRRDRPLRVRAASLRRGAVAPCTRRRTRHATGMRPTTTTAGSEPAEQPLRRGLRLAGKKRVSGAAEPARSVRPAAARPAASVVADTSGRSMQETIAPCSGEPSTALTTRMETGAARAGATPATGRAGRRRRAPPGTASGPRGWSIAVLRGAVKRQRGVPPAPVRCPAGPAPSRGPAQGGPSASTSRSPASTWAITGAGRPRTSSSRARDRA